MSHTIIPLTLAAALAFSASALAQSGGSSGGGSAGGASSGAASSGAAGAAGSGATGSGPAPGAAAAPAGSISPSTTDVSAGSSIPRARTGTELGVAQPGEGASATTGSLGPSTAGPLASETTRQQSERDRALNRNLLGGSGICQGC
jgi:hypothetical protein